MTRAVPEARDRYPHFLTITTRRPIAMPEDMRAALEKLRV